jgi:phosphoribosylaminoimidazole-succinocarboxamide synthase
MKKRELLYKGKAKSLYTTDDPELLIADFRNDTTAFDGAKHAQLDNKGRVNQMISAYIMRYLEQHGVPTHFVKSESETQAIVKKMEMLPVECVVRNIACGSLCRRLGVAKGTDLNPPLFELFLKNDKLHDPMITTDHAISFGWATSQELEKMREYTLMINQLLTRLFADAGMTLVDAKFEFGLLEGKVVLGDEISPDSCRIWDSVTKDPLDKDLFREDKGGVIEAYQVVLERLGLDLVETAG